MMIKTNILDAAKRKPIIEDVMQLKFGESFTDHMFTMEYQDGKGWVNMEIKPLAPLSLHPAANILQYCQQVFEGQKAYKSSRGETLLFRPYEHAKRFNNSLQRISMPEIPTELYLNALYELLRVEERWIPKTFGASLYIRPNAFGSEAALGVRASSQYIFSIVLSPVGPYFTNGFQPTTLWVSESYIRAAVGGTGAVKTGGNYAASLLGAKIAKENNCDQVLWLDAREGKYVEEGGAMNIFFVIEGKLITPALTGSILPGITRKTVLELAQDLGITAEEKSLTIDEVILGIENQSITEMFCTGTAVVINPVKALSYQGKIYNVKNQNGIFAQKFYDMITAIQYGIADDPKGFVFIVD